MDYWKHPLFREAIDISCEWENMFEIACDIEGKDEEAILWILENATDPFHIHFCEYYFSIEFEAGSDAMAYKLRWI